MDLTRSDLDEPDSLPLMVQEHLLRHTPLVRNNVDYAREVAEYAAMDEILQRSGVETAFVAQQLGTAGARRCLGDRRRERIGMHARRTLRCVVAMTTRGESYRDFSRSLADSRLLQEFCRYNTIDDPRTASKSTVQRMAHSIDEETVRALAVLLNQRHDAAHGAAGHEGPSLDFSTAFLDTTCLELDIHFPTDWTLLKDACRTLLRAIIVIRSHGLCKRMPPPRALLAQVNKQCMAMSAAGRRGGRKKARKATLRKLKRLAKVIAAHAERYRAALRVDLALAEESRRCDLTAAQGEQVLGRMERVMDLLPQAVKQAHERIIGERPVANAEKVLSLYEPHACVYVRGKAGRDCEFGLQCLIVENRAGLILDWQVSDTGIVPDSRALIPAVQRLRTAYGNTACREVVTDTGFSSAANSRALLELCVKDRTMPRSPRERQRQLGSPAFVRAHTRRAQTEARISILKHRFLRSRIPMKGLRAQCLFVAWSIFSHNLWLLGRIRLAEAVAAAA